MMTEEAKRELMERREIGNRLATIAFNLSQRRGEEITERAVQAMKKAYKAWDKIATEDL